MSKSNLKSSVLFLFVLLFPGVIQADVLINEIMYDLPGSDKDREWIEIYNSGPEDVDLESFNIETTSNHRPFSLISDSFILPAGGFALIVQNYDEFKKDQPNPSGIFLKSAFYLNNTSGKIILKDNEEIIDEIVYTLNWGAKGDGASLQRFRDGWLASLPTAGQTNKISPIESALNIEVAPESDKKSANISSALPTKTEVSEKPAAPSSKIQPEISGEEAGIVAMNIEKIDDSENQEIGKWLKALAGLLAFSSLAIIFSSAKKETKELKEPNLAQDIKIIVDEDNT